MMDQPVPLPSAYAVFTPSYKGGAIIEVSQAINPQANPFTLMDQFRAWDTKHRDGGSVAITMGGSVSAVVCKGIVGPASKFVVIRPNVVGSPRIMASDQMSFHQVIQAITPVPFLTIEKLNAWSKATGLRWFGVGDDAGQQYRIVVIKAWP